LLGKRKSLFETLSNTEKISSQNETANFVNNQFFNINSVNKFGITSQELLSNNN
jgi:hypothetical protein